MNARAPTGLSEIAIDVGTIRKAHARIRPHIHRTPVLSNAILDEAVGARLFFKCENLQRVAAFKARGACNAVLSLSDADAKQGVVTHSSGNHGAALAWAARARGIPAWIVMPDNVSVERRQLLEIFGAEVTLSPGAEGSNGAIRRAQEIAAAEPEYAFLYQYGNPANPLAHYEGTGPEIWADCPEVDVFVAGLGTSGTLMGVGRYLRERKPEVQIVAVEPPAGELVQGLRSLDDGFVPPIFDAEILNRKTIVRNRESIEWTRRLLDECGVFAGISSGAAVAGAAKVAAKMESGTIVTLLPDGGWKYLSSGAWTDDLDVVEERASRINYW